MQQDFDPLSKLTRPCNICESRDVPLASGSKALPVSPPQAQKIHLFTCNPMMNVTLRDTKLALGCAGGPFDASLL